MYSLAYFKNIVNDGSSINLKVKTIIDELNSKVSSPNYKKNPITSKEEDEIKIWIGNLLEILKRITLYLYTKIIFIAFVCHSIK